MELDQMTDQFDQVIRSLHVQGTEDGSHDPNYAFAPSSIDEKSYAFAFYSSTTGIRYVLYRTTHLCCGILTIGLPHAARKASRRTGPARNATRRRATARG
jgi:hypothetical protein